MERLQAALAARNVTLTNPILERTSALHSLIDGIDATLADLAAEEIGEEALTKLAVQLADETFASRQASPKSKRLLQDVFELRARRVTAIRSAGRLPWIRETGATIRLLDTVERDLLPRSIAWDDLTNPSDPTFVRSVLEWTWAQDSLREAIRDAYRLERVSDTVRDGFFDLVTLWLSGARFREMATRRQTPMDDLLGIHARVTTFVLQTLVEQGLALLEKLLQSQQRKLAPAAAIFPEHLRFGVPTTAARVLAASGVRHRSAAVALGSSVALTNIPSDNQLAVRSIARRLLLDETSTWEARLGRLVYRNTLADLAPDGPGAA
jgi:hypothetical protein